MRGRTRYRKIIGDTKYATRSAAAVNEYVAKQFRLTTQLLHADRIEFLDTVAGSESLGYLATRAFDCELPKRFDTILSGLRSGHQE